MGCRWKNFEIRKKNFFAIFAGFFPSFYPTAGWGKLQKIPSREWRKSQASNFAHMSGMIRGIQKFLFGLPGTCIWRHSTKTFFFTPRVFGRTAQLFALKFSEHMGTMNMSWGIFLEGVFIMNFFEKKIQNRNFGKFFKKWFLSKAKSYRSETRYICWAWLEVSKSFCWAFPDHVYGEKN